MAEGSERLMMGNQYGYFFAGTGKARWRRASLRDRMEIWKRKRMREKAEQARHAWIGK